MQLVKEIIRQNNILKIKEISFQELMAWILENDNRSVEGKRIITVDKFIKKYRDDNK